MIIICDNCSKKFNVKDEDIPVEGRFLQCGSCGNKWYFKRNINEKLFDKKIKEISNISTDDTNNNKINLQEEELSIKKIKIPKKTIVENLDKKESTMKKVKKEIPEETAINKKSNLIGSFFVTIITFIAIIIILDTFKNELSQIFPSIIPLLDNLYQTLYDIYLFFKDLIN